MHVKSTARSPPWEDSGEEHPASEGRCEAGRDPHGTTRSTQPRHRVGKDACWIPNTTEGLLRVSVLRAEVGIRPGVLKGHQTPSFRGCQHRQRGHHSHPQSSCASRSSGAGSSRLCPPSAGSGSGPAVSRGCSRPAGVQLPPGCLISVFGMKSVLERKNALCDLNIKEG